jgi:hypothetical protein
LLIFLFFSFQSCNKSKEQVKTVIEEWDHKEIKIPVNLQVKCIRHDKLGIDLLKHQYKILIYIDSLSCIPCRLHLKEWKAYINAGQMRKYDIGYLFVIQSKNYKKIEERLYIDNFTYPIICDPMDEFNKLNKLPKEERFQTFLLDDKNRVLLIGSPINNEKLSELYNDIIGGRKKGSVQTTEKEDNNNLSKNNANVQIDRDSVDLGRFSFKKTRHIAFQLKSIGKQPLIIQSVSTSCGCTIAKYDRKPITQGETTTVQLEYKPNSLGYFSKTADVVCNVPEGFVRLKISGEVVEK